MKRKTDKEKLIEYFEHMKNSILNDCNNECHIIAICGSIGKLDTKTSRLIFKEWLEENKIIYHGSF